MATVDKHNRMKEQALAAIDSCRHAVAGTLVNYLRDPDNERIGNEALDLIYKAHELIKLIDPVDEIKRLPPTDP